MLLLPAVESPKAGKGVQISPVYEAKCALDLADSRSLAHQPDVTVESSAKTSINKGRVDEDERLFDIETDGNDVCQVCKGEPVAIFKRQFGRVEELLVVCQHDD